MKLKGYRIVNKTKYKQNNKSIWQKNIKIKSYKWK